MQPVKSVASSFVLLSPVFINDAIAGTKRVKTNKIAKMIKTFFKINPPIFI